MIKIGIANDQLQALEHVTLLGAEFFMPRSSRVLVDEPQNI